MYNPRRKQTIVQIIYEKLKSLEINESVNLVDFITEIYGSHDKFLRYSFDAQLTLARRMFTDGETFRTIKGNLTRKT